jgi:hypothetical protein
MSRFTLGFKDTAERAEYLALVVRVGFPSYFIFASAQTLAFGYGYLDGLGLILLLTLDIPLVLLMAALLFQLSPPSPAPPALQVTETGLPTHPAHTLFETLTRRGFYHDAADGYLTLLASSPEDNLARFKLAEIYRYHLDLLDRAEQVYLDIRRHNPSDEDDRRVAHLLLELYHRTGRQDRIMVELARLADRHRKTPAGENALRALKYLRAGYQLREAARPSGAARRRSASVTPPPDPDGAPPEPPPDPPPT